MMNLLRYAQPRRLLVPICATVLAACGGGGGGDGGGDSATPTVTPSLTSVAVTAFENTPLSYQLTATDPQGGPFSFAIDGGDDAGLFTLSTDTLSLTPKNFESPADSDADNDYVVGISVTDEDGNQSRSEVTVTIADMAVIHVDADATGTGIGTSWEDAFTDLQDALTQADLGRSEQTIEIWVATGTYHPTTGTDRTATFTLRGNTTLLGGFDGTESVASERAPSTNVTTLSGDIGSIGVPGDNAYTVVTGADNTVLDGFTVRDGYADSSEPDDTSRGGGLYCSNCTIHISRCSFVDNDAATWGGAVFAAASTLTISDTSFADNHAEDYGGGVYARGGSTLTISDSSFVDNSTTTDGNGGGLYTFYCTITIADSTFTGNSSGLAGGIGVNGTTTSITGGSFTDNSAATNGGAISALRSKLSYVGPATLSDNAAIDGGAIHINRGHSDDDDIELSQLTITNNTASGSGGGIAVINTEDMSVRALGLLIDGNTAGGGGGGVFVEASDTGSPVLVFDRCSVSSNSATGGNGGGLLVSTDALVGMANSIIADNVAGSGTGGAIYSTGVVVDLVQSTVVDNDADLVGGVYYVDAAISELKNSIIYGNTSASSISGTDSGNANLAYLTANGNLASESCIIQGGHAGGVNVLTDDPDLKATAPDQYRPQTGSPAIDAGDETLYSGFDFDGDDASSLIIYELTEDYYGDTRDQGVLDIGAVEVQPVAASPTKIAN